VKQERNIKLKGNTIVEVLIALAIMSFCTSLAVVIYLNVQKSSLPFFKLKAAEVAELYMDKSLKEKSFMEETFTSGEFTVRKFVNRNERYADCFNLRVVVCDGSRKKLFELGAQVHEDN
jgi:type II secretory pathway component PulJ